MKNHFTNLYRENVRKLEKRLKENTKYNYEIYFDKVVELLKNNKDAIKENEYKHVVIDPLYAVMPDTFIEVDNEEKVVLKYFKNGVDVKGNFIFTQRMSIETLCKVADALYEVYHHYKTNG